jgi:hypothetical protein
MIILAIVFLLHVIVPLPSREGEQSRKERGTIT